MTGGASRLADAERRDWLQLIRSDNVGPATFRDLLARYGSAAAALDALPALAKRAGQRLRIHSRDDAETELAALADRDGGMVALPDPDYPPWLRHIDAPRRFSPGSAAPTACRGR